MVLKGVKAFLKSRFTRRAKEIEQLEVDRDTAWEIIASLRNQCLELDRRTLTQKDKELLDEHEKERIMLRDRVANLLIFVRMLEKSLKDVRESNRLNLRREGKNLKGKIRYWKNKARSLETLKKENADRQERD